MTILEQPQRGAFADLVQITANPASDSCRLDFQLGKGDVLLCLSSGFAPEPTINLLADLDERQERMLLDEHGVLTLENCNIQLQLHSRSVLSSRPVSFIELSVPKLFNLPLCVQLWSYDPQKNTVAPNLSQNTVYMKASLSYSASRNFLTGKTKVYISKINLQGFPDGFLCYRAGNYEYPIPNSMLCEPFKLNLGEVNIQAAAPWQHCISVRRE